MAVLYQRVLSVLLYNTLYFCPECTVAPVSGVTAHSSAGEYWHISERNAVGTLCYSQSRIEVTVSQSGIGQVSQGVSGLPHACFDVLVSACQSVLMS